MSQTPSEQPGWRRLRGLLAQSPPLLWSSLYFFCLLTAYFVLRPVRDAMGANDDIAAVFPPPLIAWFAARGIDLGEFTLQALFTVTFVIMVALQPVYGAVVSRYPRRVFLPAVYVFFIACLLAFYVAFDSALPGRGALFFVWVAVFNMFAVTVFWSFMADLFSDIEARRLYGYIGAAGTLGALIGPIVTRLLVERIGIANLLLISASLLALCLLCITRLRGWALLRERERGVRSNEEALGGGILAGLRLAFSEPLLRAFALLMFFGVGVGTLLYNEQAAIARAYYPDPDARAGYFASIDLAVNGLTLIVQLLLTRPLLSRYGVAPALLIPVCAILIGFAVLTASPLPMLIAVVQVVTRAGEFSLSKPARESIYTRVAREWRYKAKATIDTVVYRGSDLSFVWLHKLLGLGGSSLVFGAGTLVAVAMGLSAWRLVREQSKLVEAKSS